MHSFLFLIATFGQAPPLAVPPNWSLLTHPTVQSALQLSVPQTRAIFAIRSTGNIVLKRLARKHAKAPTPDPALPALEKFGKGLPLAKQERLSQITLQAYGPYVLTAPGVAKSLGLTGVGVDRITNLQLTEAATYNEKVRLYAAAHHVPTRIEQGDTVVPVETPGIRQMHDERDAKLTELLKQNLTKEQNDLLAKMLGKPVKLN